MKLSNTLLLASSVLPAVTVASDEGTAEQFKISGMCAWYYNGPYTWKLLANTCIDYCKAQDEDNRWFECDVSNWKEDDTPFEELENQGLVTIDESGDKYLPSPCKCENPDWEPILDALFNTIASGLSKLDDVICGVMMTAMVSIVEVGIEFVPGGNQAKAAGRAVEAAKSFTENALDVADSMGSWVSSACGINDPDWPNSIFDYLVEAPAEFGESIGCKRENKSDCRK